MKFIKYFIVLILLIFILYTTLLHHNIYNSIYSSSTDTLTSPSFTHWLGTDSQGRDFFIRLIFATIFSLSFSILINIIGIFFGIILGIIGSYLPWQIGFNVIESSLSIPYFVLGGIFSILLGTSLPSLFITFGFMWSLPYAYMLQSYIQQIESSYFIKKSRIHGYSRIFIICFHIVPITLYKIRYQATISIHSTIFALSSMTFLGFGLQAPLPELGSFIYENSSYASSYPLLLWSPFFIFLLLSIFIYYTLNKPKESNHPIDIIPPLPGVFPLYLITTQIHNTHTFMDQALPEIKRADILLLKEDYYLNFPNKIILEKFLKDSTYNYDIDTIDLYLKSLELPPNILTMKPTQLSGGMLQRMSILLGLIYNPKYLILENPLSSVEPRLKNKVFELLINTYKGNLIIIAPYFDISLINTNIQQLFFYSKQYQEIPYNSETYISNPIQIDMQKAYTNTLWLECSYIQTNFNIDTLNIKFSIYKNEILGIIGPSGIGKSTLGKILTGIEPLYSGKIINYLEDIKGEMVEQNPAQFNPYISSWKIIYEFSIHSNKKTKLFVKILLRRLSLPEAILKIKMIDLNKSEQYKILLIRAILYQPNLLILDELFDHIPYEEYQSIIQILQELQKDTTILIISHQQKWVEKISTRVIELTNN